MDERRSLGGYRWSKVTVVALLGLVVSSTGLREAAGQDDDQRGGAEVRNCIDLRSIDRTEVVDDDTLLFFMRGGEVYRNDLPNRCPQLESEERFMYRVALSQLCDIDVITVLMDMGFGFMPGASCGLGKFQPISADVAEQLLSQSN